MTDHSGHERAETGTGDDATLNDFPLTRAERIWGFWDFSFVNVGVSVATWAFIQGAAVAYYVGAVQAVATTAIGYAIGTLFVALAPCVPTAKYGIDQFVVVRSIFGSSGARVVMLAMSALLVAAWSGLLAIMFGRGMTRIANALLDTDFSPDSVSVTLFGLASLAVSWVVLSRGPISVDRISMVIAPVLLLITAAVVFQVFTRTSWSELVALAPLGPQDDPHLNVMLAIELGIAGGLSWWPNMGNLARLTRTTRSAFWPNWFGLFLASTVAAGVGAFAALLLQQEDPIEWMVPLGGVALGSLALVFIGFANMIVIISQTYSSMIALKGASGRIRSMRWPLLGVSVLIPPAVLVFFPSAVYDNYARFLSWGALLVVPICAVQCVDFFILRRAEISPRDLYLPAAQSAYGFWHGYNLYAFVAVAAGGVVYVLLLNPVTYEPSPLFGYATASLPAFAVAAALHYLFTRFVVIKNGDGGYRPQPVTHAVQLETP